ncbi:MAG: glycosyltransferase family 4 protein [Clostridiales bacterium]|nr:glycosyltransferase family 4 protein [Clostridiales bacterium]
MVAVPSFWPSQDGVASITGYLAEGLAAKGHEIYVLTSAGKGGLQELPEREMHEGVTITRMRVHTQWPLFIRGRDKKSTEQTYWKYIRDYNPDVLLVVCAQTWTLDWIIPYLKRLQCVKVFYSHGYSLLKERYSYQEYLKKRNIVGAWAEYKCKKYYDHLYKYLKLFDRVIYLSEQSNAALYAEKHALVNGTILKNAIDDRFFDETMRHQYHDTELISYLFVANFNENKNQEMLIRAFCRAKIGKSRLVFVGFEKNEYYDHLQDVMGEELDQRQEKEVVFYVHISRQEVLNLYKTCDVFVCPSKSEIYPIVAHEAAATGMPVISTDVGIYSKITGAYIVNDVEQMRTAIEDLYNHTEERKRRGQAAYEWICGQGCRIQDKVDWLEEDLQRLLLKSKPLNSED